MGQFVEGKNPAEIVDFYHQQFTDNFLRLGFTHDLYAKTMDPEHQQLVQQFFQCLYEQQYLFPKIIPQLYCSPCQRFLVDRYVEGECPNCHANGARGDQCDLCGKTYEAIALINPHCKTCASSAQIKESTQLHFNLQILQPKLTAWIDQVKHNWRTNAQHTTEGWLKEGLTNRAVTRDIDWGIPVPIEGFTDKVIYVWFEAVLGYLTTSIRHCGGDLDAGPWEAWWRKENNPLHYYVHGKDNIPFHTIIFPAMLLAYGNLALATHIISSEYLQLPAGQKFSTSQGCGTTIPDFLDLVGKVSGLEVDSLRFFLIANHPENKDAQFSWTELANQHNTELVNKLSNLVNRIHKLTLDNFHNQVPEPVALSTPDQAMLQVLVDGYQNIGTSLEAGSMRQTSRLWLEIVEKANAYLNQQAPWKQIKTDRQQAANTLYVGWQVLCNLHSLLQPFLPFTCQRLANILNLPPTTGSWRFTTLPAGTLLGSGLFLFTRINRADLPAD
ncbi:MAG: methionine--tRNA ligase [Candidatus Komeilibacteria bacterium CG_4_10_14_0_2_um_filter_37_10]|uniref:Methionine--tRNA ligase n=1 Tax=Candidatus Komeilibacteria bacterium CG_4_10_14_0_2_um_filter_37_10 TaxID=1974470 RepID=A0A2M7VD85_9BACT|nr:MAG: methionine--tRNA ligase [Candidatus Komeilibacteria bacterium CG_4_10_14_0_2_um_filter_37_10]